MCLCILFGLGFASVRPAFAATTNIFSTQFEATEGYSTTINLVGQNGWLGFGSGGNGLVTNYLEGHGQQAFIGFFPPDQGDDQLSVWRPINLAPVPTNMPVVQFSVLMSIVDSSTTDYDDFYWSVYNEQGDSLFTLDFDNYNFRIYYLLDGTNNFVGTGKTFTNDDTNTLVITMNFTQNSWAATFDGVLLATNKAITTTGAPLNLGYVDAVWVVFDPAYPGDNYMLFDNYQITAEVLPPPARAEEARFFRMAGPVASTITAFSADGYVTWTNAPTNATFTVQTASSLLSPINWVDYIQVPATNPVTTHRLYDPHPPSGMALIPAGSFTMGNTFSGEGDSDEVPTHTVDVSAFYMDRTEVTKALWDEVKGWNGGNGYVYDNPGLGKAANHPVHTVSWYDVVKWCNARSQKEGRTPAYYTDVALTQVYKTGQVEPYVNWNAGYRLPTEAEWEKAARGGASGHRFPWSNVETITHSQANYYSTNAYTYDTSSTRGYHPTFNDGVEPYTSPVGYFAANANGYGLYDMAGNVCEWCWDWYGSYSSGLQTDPRGAASGSYRVVRGGGWVSYARGCRTAYRIIGSPGDGYSDGGFRSVLPPGQ
jgi:formylglycine-generating enzyme required for sulfatase activity